jgi:hypothetical protein
LIWLLTWEMCIKWSRWWLECFTELMSSQINLLYQHIISLAHFQYIDIYFIEGRSRG